MRTGKLTLSTLRKINLAMLIFPFVLPLVFVVTRIDLGNILIRFRFLQLITVSLSSVSLEFI